MRQKLSLIILYWLRFWARRQLGRVNPRIIGVTGSVGKSTTCAAIAAILVSKYKLHYGEHANSESGIPLDILGITPRDYSIPDWARMVLVAPVSLLKKKPDWEIYLAEMGVDSPKWPRNMDFLLSIFGGKVDVGVFLNARLTHSENFENLDQIVWEKKKLVNHASYKIIVENNKVGNLNTKDIHINFPNYLVPEDQKVNFLAAMAVAEIFKIGKEEAIKVLEKNFKMPPGRMTKITGINDTSILDSSYNASKSAVFSALEVLKTVKGKRKIALLGDMRELGKFAQTEHEEVAKRAAQIADVVFTVGPLTKKYFPETVKNFPNSYEAGLYLKSFLRPGDVILIKGSQNTIFLETAVEMLMNHPEEADKLLCRRGEFWDRKRDAYKKKN